jgi:hypothetical protein
VGINYGAPTVPPMVVMSVFGMRWLHAKVYRRVQDLRRARLMCALGVPGSLLLRSLSETRRGSLINVQPQPIDRTFATR